mmetsp:Transcript_48419/g.117203  ORF Transcript_48419/g.117203 Transcript_48419/m.117203 type:complete len:135 (-) Transcript_48419:243-647(-)|eukprot:CAMPEP_0113485162 /NCGR_PEP_ID=MMETSP0014_2-20120614/24341_1 /TAXON_ID=2857 /ORGANISM="Nitzschia sp." /LENGTH=134 /DNA_ID=CAMNT_0000378799 /DNA_START=380 /DNA_END=784 /DNA_ORIENTATION=- /assembly_acc=CAM_ASM_000159
MNGFGLIGWDSNQINSLFTFLLWIRMWIFLVVDLQALLRSLQPLGERVLVKRAPKEVQTSSGIYLPTDSAKDPNEGEVLAVGPGERDVTGTLHATSLKAGDKVLLPEYGGTKVKMGDDEVFLFRESDILGKFEG